MKKNQKKLFLNKKTLAELDLNQMYSINGGEENCTKNNTGCESVATCPGKCDHDTPTVNDNCDMEWTTLGDCNTYGTCDPKDWCGYYHETNCSGPLSTVC